MYQSNTSHSARQPRRRNRRQRQLPDGFISASDLVDLGIPQSTAYASLKQGKLGTVHKWRGLLVVKAEAADEFLAVRPIHAAGGEADGR